MVTRSRRNFSLYLDLVSWDIFRIRFLIPLVVYDLITGMITPLDIRPEYQQRNTGISAGVLPVFLLFSRGTHGALLRKFRHFIWEGILGAMWASYLWIGSTVFCPRIPDNLSNSNCLNEQRSETHHSVRAPVVIVILTSLVRLSCLSGKKLQQLLHSIC